MTKIDWANETLNPLGWGCYGPGGSPEKPKRCWYCYAHRMAKRGLKDCPDCKAFVLHWHQEAFNPLLEWRKPRRIFVQSMGDLFGGYVPEWQVKETLTVAQRYSQHTFIFLTKEPWNLAKWNPFPRNAWVGASATSALEYATAFLILPHVSARVKLLSLEPLLWYPASPPALPAIDWLIIGALTGPGANRYAPKPSVIADILAEADSLGIPVFLKNNLLKLFPELPRRQEYPNAD